MSTTMIVVITLAVFILCLICLALFVRWSKVPATATKHTQPTGAHQDGKCDHHTCGAIDPVSDPDYNMKEVIQQSILLEDHMSNERKYCVDCITKHFLALIGYCNEALTLAGNEVDKYPFMTECPSTYENMYAKWSKHKHDTKVRLDVLTELREVRKRLMASYLA